MSCGRVCYLAVFFHRKVQQVFVCHELDRFCNGRRFPEGNGLLDHERVSGQLSKSFQASKALRRSNSLMNPT